MTEDNYNVLELAGDNPLHFMYHMVQYADISPQEYCERNMRQWYAMHKQIIIGIVDILDQSNIRNPIISMGYTRQHCTMVERVPVSVSATVATVIAMYYRDVKIISMALQLLQCMICNDSTMAKQCVYVFASNNGLFIVKDSILASTLPLLHLCAIRIVTYCLKELTSLDISLSSHLPYPYYIQAALVMCTEPRRMMLCSNTKLLPDILNTIADMLLYLLTSRRILRIHFDELMTLTGSLLQTLVIKSRVRILWKIARLCDVNHFIHKITTHNVFEIILSMLHPNTATFEPAVLIVGHIAMSTDEYVTQMIKRGLLFKIHKYINTRSSAINNIAKWIYNMRIIGWTLSNIAVGPPTHIQAMIDIGLIETMVSNLTVWHSDIVKEMCWALLNMMESGSEKQLFILCKEYQFLNGLAKCIQTMNTSSDEQFLLLVVSGVITLMKRAGKYRSAVEHLLYESGLLDALSMVTRKSVVDTQLRNNVCQLVESFSNKENMQPVLNYIFQTS